ncbi:MAG TPA: PIN domain-containing protein [Caulobacteraceae bacterium]
MSEAFIDTNVALYLVGGEPSKATMAERLIGRGGVVSVQVLTEFTDVMRRKYKASWPIVRDLLAALRANVQITPVTLETHELGLIIAERYGFRVYDAQLVAAALQAGCTTFWSEDLHDGQVIDGRLTIRNPFRADGA